MSSAGILRPDEVVFYHPLDNFTEHTQSQTWTGTGAFVAGKVGSAESAVTADAPSFGSSQVIAPGGDGTSSSFFTQAKMAALDSTRLVVGYKDGSPGKVRVVTVSGNTFTMGPEQTIDTSLGTGYSVSVIALTSTTVVFVWNDGVTKVRAGTVSGTDITIGAEVAVPAGDVNFYGMPVAMGATKFVILGGIFAGANRDHRAVVGEVSGLDVTLGPGVTIHVSPSAVVIAGIGLDSTRLVVGYPDSGTVRVRICTLSGLTLTVGPEFTGPAGTVAKSMVRLDAATFVFLFGEPRLRAVVGSVSGTSITLGPSVDWSPPGHSNSAPVAGSALNSTSIIAVRSRYGPPSAQIGTVSGLDITFGARTSLDTLGDAIGVGCLDGSTFFVSGHDATDAEGAVGLVDMSSSMTAPTPGAYPSVIGDTRCVVAMWARNLAAGSSQVLVERGFDFRYDCFDSYLDLDISFGGSTVEWKLSGMGTAVNDGSPHLLVFDFEHEGGGVWRLRSSVDGAAFTDQGTGTGTEPVPAADTAPRLEIADGATDQWIDELVMWTGDKSTFDPFTSEELANLNDLADTFGEAMDKYEENYGAPICWQATATMPDGTAWRDSGSGPCPPVIRIPRGASDIVVTDEGKQVHPRIQEG